MDLPSQTQWDTSRAQPGQSGIITTFLGGSAAQDPGRGSVESILSDLDRISPGSRELYDGNQAQFRWAENPFVKGSYACPRPGQYTAIMGSAKEPELGGRLLFAGEHVSEKYQGYMNGAVETANAAAKAIIAGGRAGTEAVARSFRTRRASVPVS
jgi:monoamine oxidase